MDPQTIKLIQRLVAEIAGIGVLIWGLIFIYKGIAGKITFVMKGGGMAVKLANASPGVFIALIGGILVWYSMKDFSVEKKTTTSEVNETEIMDQWLLNSNKITGDENYIKTIDSVVGTDKTNRFKVEYVTIHPPESLGDVASKQYGDRKYWRLVGVANIGKGYFEWKTATINTKVADSSLLEIWKVSKYYGKTTEEIVKVSGTDKKESYNLMMLMAQSKPDYNPLEHIYELSNVFKAKELNLVQTPANYSGGIETIGELSLKYYGDKNFWRLIVWTNKEELKGAKSSDYKPDKTKTIYILHFIP
ncbi:MAG: hypothetical protein JWQ09_2931 [Segetibacter sp.]|nr:hypothetical protein [Segetibacter sp.]